MLPIVTLKKHEENRLRASHLWAFSNEIARISAEPLPGDLVEVHTSADKYVGVGFFNPHSLIAVRIVGFDERARSLTDLDTAFFRERISSALALRTKMFDGANAYRIVHGESDFLPGLIVDRYADVVSVQTLSAGMDRRLEIICEVLRELLNPAGLIERNDVALRTLEGLDQKKGLLAGGKTSTVIEENGVQYDVDVLEGQKTGFFLDQRENRRAIRAYSRGAAVLDMFCNDGGFALNAAAAGAGEVTAVDISERATAKAAANADRNRLSTIRFENADAFDFLRGAGERAMRFDVVNLDPPSFAPNRKSVHAAKKAYGKLHALALGVLKPGGILATASCSHHIFEETFLEIVNEAAREQDKQLSVLEWRGASADHPSLPAMPETKYLKFGVFRVVSGY